MRTSFAVATLVSCANAFWGMGHLLIAREAEALLEKNNPDALKAALDVLKPLQSSKQYPDLIKSEKDHPFTECATFADEIKGEGMTWQSNWHFVDQPYYDQGGSAKDFPKFKPSDVKVCDALDALTKFLKGDKSVDDTVYVKTVKSHFDDEADQKSFALRLVIHYAGDIHQPLHAVSAVDNDYPSGDRGGNDEHMPTKDEVNELHALWDSVIYDFGGRPKLPFEDELWDSYTKIAGDTYEKYTPDQDKLLPGQFETWADEGLAIAKEAVYDGFKINSLQTDEYLKRAEPLLKARMMYASARLQDIIVDIYDSDNSTADSAFVFTTLFEAFLQ